MGYVLKLAASLTPGDLAYVAVLLHLRFRRRRRAGHFRRKYRPKMRRSDLCEDVAGSRWSMFDWGLSTLLPGSAIAIAEKGVH